MADVTGGYNWGGWGDAAGGAAAGATIGALGGPAGALIGAGIGGLGGFIFGGGDDGRGANAQYQYDPNYDNFMMPGYADTRSQYDRMIGQDPRNAPQAGTSSFRGDQSQLARMLMSQAQGQGPGQEIARMQAEQQVDRGLAQQMAGARSARPGQSAMAARNAAMASGQLQGAGAQAATLGGLQAQQTAVGQLGGVLQGARGQDLQRNLSNANLRLQQMGLDDQRQMQLLAQRLQADRYQQLGGQAYEGAMMGKAGAEFQHAANQPSTWDKVLGAAQGIGQAGMMLKAGSQKQQPGYSAFQAPYTSYYGNPQSYDVPELTAGQLWNRGGFGGNLGQPGQSLGVDTSLNQPYAGNPYSGAMSGYALPRLY